MEQEDYLKKQIDQLGRVLGKIMSDLLGLKNQGKVNDGVETTNQALKGELDFDLTDLIDTPPDQLIDKLTAQEKFSHENLEKLAEILLFMADNQTENRKRMYEMSLAILEYLEESEGLYSLDRKWKIERIKSMF